jgi:hypothetical protein
VEVRAKAVLEIVENNPPEEVRPTDVRRMIKTVKPNKACRFEGIPNECLWHFPKRPLVYFTHLFNH